MTPAVAAGEGRLGAWRTVIEEIGFPVGRPQTVVVESGRGSSCRPRARSASSRTCGSTGIRSWSARRDGACRTPRLTRLDPAVADLRWRGFSAETTPDGREPFGYDYQRVSSTVAVEGDGRALHARRETSGRSSGAIDDMFVVSRPGDEIALSFDAASLPPLPSRDGRGRSCCYVHGYSKEMNPRSASPDTVGAAAVPRDDRLSVSASASTTRGHARPIATTRSATTRGSCRRPLPFDRPRRAVERRQAAKASDGSKRVERNNERRDPIRRRRLPDRPGQSARPRADAREHRPHARR